MIDIINDAVIERLLRVGDLIEPMRRAFANDCKVPKRVQHEIDVSDARSGVLLVMPAWTRDDALGVKLATVFPDNAGLGIPTISATYVLMSAKTGEVTAILSGAALTLNRTAAVSALAADLLARSVVQTLLLIGTGDLVPYLARAHTCVRHFQNVRVWGRSHEKAVVTADKIARDLDLPVEAVATLENGVRSADVISAATLSETALIDGAWLKPGTHIDLVGSFKPTMRESNDIAVQRARVFVDTRDAVRESGDLTQPLANGTIGADHILGDLAELVKGELVGRRYGADITLFKSVGTALADLAAASFILQLRHSRTRFAPTDPQLPA